MLLFLGLWGLSCSNTANSSEGNRGPRKKALPGSAGGALKVLERAGPIHPVFDLADNRLLAHQIQEGGLLIPMGHPGLAKYLSFLRPWNTWRPNEKVDGRRVALAVRSVTWLEFPLGERQTKASMLTLSVKSPAAQGLAPTLNRTKLKPLRLSPGWQKVSFPIPERALAPGENRLELSWGATGRFSGEKASGAVEWIHLGEQAPSEPSALTQGGKLLLPRGGGLAYYVHPYRDAKLHLRFQGQPGSTRCDLRLRLQAQGERPLEAVHGSEGAAESEALIELAALTERVSRLELLAEGAGCKGLRLGQAALVMPGAAPLRRRAQPPKNVVFWMIDNVRSDRYSVYNPGTRVQTPVISELAKTGTLFTRAYIQGNESRVSHASIWTGLYPRQHHFIDAKAKLSLDWVTLPEAVRKAGLHTAAWIANGFVSKFWGFGEGWSQFRNNLHQGGGLTGEALANQAIEFIKGNDKPFYLYVGTIDPHVSWRGRQPWLKQYHPEPYQGPFQRNVLGKDVEKMAVGKRQTSPEDRKRILAIYDSTVSYNDQQLGRLLAALKEKGNRDETMVVITADHGEELWDYGKIGHGASIKDQIVAVPLIIHYPPLFGSGVRVRQGVDVLSLMPTILDALGAPVPDTVQGPSLLPLAQGIGAGYPRPAFASQYELAHAIRLERWKLWVGGKGEPRLYDMQSPRHEHQEVGAQHPLETRWLTDALGTFLTYQDRWRSSRWGVASNHDAALAADLESSGGPPPIRAGR